LSMTNLLRPLQLERHDTDWKLTPAPGESICHPGPGQSTGRRASGTAGAAYVQLLTTHRHG
jgi:hypothetical protein